MSGSDGSRRGRLMAALLTGAISIVPFASSGPAAAHAAASSRRAPVVARAGTAGAVEHLGSFPDFGLTRPVEAPVEAPPVARPPVVRQPSVRRVPSVRAESAGPAVTYQTAASDSEEPSDADFDRLAQCESSGRWDLDARNGFYGGLQFTLSTWRSLGGVGLPSERPRDEQIDIGRREWHQHRWRAWPSCARKFRWR